MEQTLSGKGTQWVTGLRETRKINVGAEGTPEGYPIGTVTGLFQNAVQQWGNIAALHSKRDGAWKSVTWKEYEEVVQKVARALIHLGLQEYDVVSIMGFNCPEWFFADVGTIFAGGVVSGIYSTNSPEACRYQIDASNTKIVFVENETQLKKFLQIRNQIPQVTAFVQWSGTVPTGVEGVYSWENFIKLADNVSPSVLEERLKNQTPERCVQLIYTSGSTGNPKGVMISNDNITWTANTVSTLLDVTEKDVMISYLPLSHVAAMMLDIIAQMRTGLQIYFAQPDALKGSLVKTLHEVRPTIFFGVPRVWEKIQEKMQEVGRSKGHLAQHIANLAKSIGLKGSYALQTGHHVPWGWWLANTMVFHHVRKGLGLDRCRLCVTGAAPISMETLNYFMSLNIPLYELYGMSECCGPTTFNTPEKVVTGSVGRPIPGAEIKIKNPDEHGEGEVLVKGRHIFLGYLNKDDATAETFDSEGFMLSGDLGKIDSKGFLYITGRSKELLVTAGGENVAPVLLETEVKKALGDLLSNVMVIGDKRKFLSCIITLPTKPNPNAVPPAYPFTNELSHSAVEILHHLGSTATTVEEASQDPKVLSHIKEALNQANKSAPSDAQRIQKFVIAPNDFTIEGDELTPTMKIKRRVVLQKYDQLIQSMYA